VAAGAEVEARAVQPALRGVQPSTSPSLSATARGSRCPRPRRSRRRPGHRDLLVADLWPRSASPSRGNSSKRAGPFERHQSTSARRLRASSPDGRASCSPARARRSGDQVVERTRARPDGGLVLGDAARAQVRTAARRRSDRSRTRGPHTSSRRSRSRGSAPSRLTAVGEHQVAVLS